MHDDTSSTVGGIKIAHGCFVSPPCTVTDYFRPCAHARSSNNRSVLVFGPWRRGKAAGGKKKMNNRTGARKKNERYDRKQRDENGVGEHSQARKRAKELVY